MRMRWHRLTAVDAAAAFISIGVVAPVLWMALDRTIPYEITNGWIDPPTPHRGEDIVVSWDIRPVRACRPYSGRVTQVIIDSRGFRHVATPDTASYGTPQQYGPNKLRRTVMLPPHISGPTKYYAEDCYSCNPLQTIWPVCWPTPVLDFIIKD